MPRWLDDLQDDLDRLDAQHLRRKLTPIERANADSPSSASPARLIQRGGQSLINFASNDYLALSDHPHLKAVAIAATQQWGTGSGASRLVTGHLAIHEEVESRFAAFKHAEKALLCPTGYLANMAVLTTLAGPGDLICIDKLSHASLIDAARFSGATVRVYPHLNHDKLARLLSRSEGEEAGAGAARQRGRRTFIVTDSIFSMDGDAANLQRLCDLATEYEAILMVDEAHGTGLYGATGAGLCEAMGVSDRVDIVISTASKALGGLGGIITAKEVIIDSLINHARSFIYTTAVPAAQTATIGAALDVIRDEPWRRDRVMQLATQVREVTQQWEKSRGVCDERDELVLNRAAPEFPSPIVPIITGSPESAIALAKHLASQSIHAPAIRPPTVAPGSSRIRLTLRADMTEDDVQRLRDALNSFS